MRFLPPPLWGSFPNFRQASCPIVHAISFAVLCLQHLKENRRSSLSCFYFPLDVFALRILPNT